MPPRARNRSLPALSSRPGRDRPSNHPAPAPRPRPAATGTAWPLICWASTATARQRVNRPSPRGNQPRREVASSNHRLVSVVRSSGTKNRSPPVPGPTKFLPTPEIKRSRQAANAGIVAIATSRETAGSGGAAAAGAAAVVAAAAMASARQRTRLTTVMHPAKSPMSSLVPENRVQRTVTMTVTTAATTLPATPRRRRRARALVIARRDVGGAADAAVGGEAAAPVNGSPESVSLPNSLSRNNAWTIW